MSHLKLRQTMRLSCVIKTKKLVKNRAHDKTFLETAQGNNSYNFCPMFIKHPVCNLIVT